MKRAWKSIALLILGLNLFSIGWTHAEDSYQTDFVASSRRTKRDDGSENNFKKFTMIRYFRPVKTAGHPLAEATFLEHIGNLNLFVSMSEVRTSSGFEEAGPSYGAFLNLRRPEWPMTMIIGMAKSEFEFDAPVNARENGDSLTLGIGAFLNKAFHIGLEYQKLETIRTLINLQDVQKFSFETVRYRIVSKFVLELDQGRAMNILANIESTRFDFPNGQESNKSRSLLADYYFNPRLSLGGGFGKSETGKSYSVRASAFMKPPFAISLGFSKFLADDSGGDSQSLNLSLLARF